jgi:uncharacterized protein YbaR (Trm112 family)/SAM-dependent methyltransferase
VSNLKLSKVVQELLRCPVCRAKLDMMGEQFVCANPECGSHFPIIDGIPILLNKENSIFTIDDFLTRHNTTFNPGHNKVRETLYRLMPGISKNIKAEQNCEKFVNLLLGQSSAPRVLIIGGSILGQGVESLVKSHSLDLVETDVSFGPRTMLICDAHDIPVEDESFDGVIVQAVLEHVVDPYRCVEEIYRVLKKQGLVYAETPFMQQVHMGRYDFTRFTYLGHRRLFRRFDEIESGAICGPGMALAWAYQYFLWSFTESRVVRSFVRIFAVLTSFYLKYFDYYLIDKAGTLDAASGYYFMGRRASHVLSDRELIRLYRGAQG